VFDRLFDFFANCLWLFRFGAIVDAYENAVILRFGRLRKVITEPGFYWMAPFYIDRIISDTAVLATREMPTQLVTLADGVTISIQPVISFETADAAKFFLSVDNAEAALTDAARGTVRDVLAALTWEQISGENGATVTEKLTKAVRKVAVKYGIRVTQVAPADLAKVRAFRFITGG
jgi:modulator of FtsH protease HflC